MAILQLERVFSYKGETLADPNPRLSVEAVKDFYSTTYPEIINASQTEEIKDGKIIYTFSKALGTKG